MNISFFLQAVVSFITSFMCGYAIGLIKRYLSSELIVDKKIN